MTPRVTHTRLPGGRQDFKLHAEGKVRLRELTDTGVRPVGEGNMARGGGSTEKLRLQQVPMNLKLALTALVTLCLAEMAGCFDRCGHVKA